MANTEFPPPQIGFYQAECCLLDLYKIETPEDLAYALARVDDNWENGPLMVFATLAEAIAYLADDGLTAGQEAREYARLGWAKT
jgi:hypothetical protein